MVKVIKLKSKKYFLGLFFDITCTSENHFVYLIIETLKTGKMKENNVVYNKRYNTIGIVLSIFDMGEVRTDADGVVYLSDLLIIKSEDHLNEIVKAVNPTIAISTYNQINNLNLLK